MIAAVLFITAELFTFAAMFDTNMSSKVTNKTKTHKCGSSSLV